MNIQVGDRVRLPSGVAGVVAGVSVRADGVDILVGSPHSEWIDAAGAEVDPAPEPDPAPASAEEPAAPVAEHE